ncbi:CoA-transferase family III [Abortiporus biennis]|nr:CoA-transferase family III [Abortiporus biennis]
MSNHPLSGIKVVEFAGLAPGPFAGLILSDWGADVIRVDKPPVPNAPPAVTQDFLARNKRSIAIDPKVPSGLETVRKLVNSADVLIDPFRPGVMERLGLGPDVFLGPNGSNKKLVYARLVGFSRTGTGKDQAGHDLNYIALSGVLSLLPGTSSAPSFPLNILADFAGGGLMCALGILVALFERETKSGLGQVVESDMVSGTRYLSSFPLIQSYATSVSPKAVQARSAFSDTNASTRMQNLLDGGAPYYGVYTCADGRWMSVGCLEPKFFKIFLERFIKALPGDFMKDVEGAWVPNLERQGNRAEWLKMKEYFESGFRLYGRDYWEKVFEGSDACAMPVLTPAEASTLIHAANEPPSLIPHPHPRLTRSPFIPIPAEQSEGLKLTKAGQHTKEILDELELTEQEKSRLVSQGALGKEVRTFAKL